MSDAIANRIVAWKLVTGQHPDDGLRSAVDAISGVRSMGDVHRIRSMNLHLDHAMENNKGIVEIEKGG